MGAKARPEAVHSGSTIKWLKGERGSQSSARKQLGGMGGLKTKTKSLLTMMVSNDGLLISHNPFVPRHPVERDYIRFPRP